MNKGFTVFLLVFILHLDNCKLHGQTNVSGTINSNTIWTLANSPYIVTDTVKVKSSVTLTIEAGVIVKIADNKRIEINTGTLIAAGTANQPIIFTSNSSNPAPGIWEGLLINAVPSSLTKLEYCNFYYAKKAVGTVFRIGNPNYIEVRNCLFTRNKTGILCSSGYIYTIKQSGFRVNDIGISYENSGTSPGISVRDCLLDSNKIYGIDLNVGRNTINNCQIKNNAVGINDLYARGRVFINNIIEGNGIGLKLGVKKDVFDTLICNTFCNNITYAMYYGGGIKDTLVLSNNYWCTTDTLAIAKSIYDKSDNASAGTVIFKPFKSTSCNPVSGLNKDLTAIRDISISPNPVNTVLNYSLPFDLLNGEIRIFNSLGEVVIFKVCEERISNIELSHLPLGIYFFNFSKGQVIFNTKFMKL